MKTYKHYLLGVAVTGALVVGTSACNRELLTPIPQTSVADVSAFSTVNRIQTQLLSLYGAGGLKDGNLYGGRYVIYGDIRGEDFINELSNLVTGSDVWNLNPTNSTTAVQNLWSASYLTINKCNIFIEGMAAGGASVVGDALSNQYIAEAKLIRGLVYYGLLQYYARPYADGNGANPGVPLRLTGIKGTGQSSIARSSVSDVYAQVLKDLNEAESGLPSTYTATVAGENTTRAHKNTAIALKTRVYLSMQRYADVVTEANKIVNSTAPFRAASGVPNQLLSDVTTIYGTAANNELIFALPMTTTAGDFPGTQNQLAYYYSPIGSNGGVGNGEYSLNPRGIIAESSWTSTDRRRSFIRTSGTGTSAKSWLIKYKQPTPYTDWVPVIRYAEVMLNLAEARVRTTNSVDAQAVALLNAVRNRSDAATTFTTASFASATALTNAILLERRIEFLGEGLRNNDLMRLLQTIPAKGSVPAKAPTEPSYIWPISASELALNNLITDN